MTLSDRKAAILQAVVEGYITTSEPVGSAHVGRASGLDVSSATIRSEMVQLEEEGYLNQPHTSAGRIPSDKGYRYFVDTLMEPHQVAHGQAQKVSSFFGAAQGELERIMRDTSSFLATLTDYASLVVGPQPEASPIRAVQVVRLASDQAMVLVVHANAAIERALVPVSAELSDDHLERAGQQVAEAWTSFTVADRRSPAPTGIETVDATAEAVSDTVAQMSARVAGGTEAPVFVGGQSTVAGLFDAVEKVQDVLVVLEKQYMVVTLVKDLIDRGLDVAIGSETGVEPLAECSLVLAPVQVDGVNTATIGLLGPTRMQYSQAMATVALVSKELGRRLEGQS